MASFKIADTVFLGKYFMVACDKFLICDPESDVRVCCCANNTANPPYNTYFYKIKCGQPITVTLAGITNLSPTEACDNCSLLNGAYELPNRPNGLGGHFCDWQEFFTELGDCYDDFADGDFGIALEASIICCEYTVSEVLRQSVVLQLGMRVDIDLVTPPADFISFYKVLDDRVSASECVVLDLTNLNEILDVYIPSEGDDDDFCMGYLGNDDPSNLWCYYNGATATITN